MTTGPTWEDPVAAPAVTAGRTVSVDGTPIAYEHRGDGPPVIVVDGAGCHRAVGPARPLAALLAADLTVYTYDRRGRGESGDTSPYDQVCEVEDLAAVIEAAGGSAYVYGISSGALLALQAAACQLTIPKLALFEPPIRTGHEPPDDTPREIAELVAAGRRGDAVARFQTAIGLPPDAVASARETPVWPELEAVAHTLVYDLNIAQEATVDLARGVTVPTLVIDSAGTTGDLPGWAAALVAALPDGRHVSLPGAWHDVAPEVLAPALLDFFTGRR